MKRDLSEVCFFKFSTEIDTIESAINPPFLKHVNSLQSIRYIGQWLPEIAKNSQLNRYINRFRWTHQLLFCKDVHEGMFNILKCITNERGGNVAKIMDFK